MPPIALRPRSTTELIDAAVSLLRQHYLELVTTTAIFTIPAIIARVLLTPTAAAYAPGQIPRLPAGYFQGVVLAGFIAFFLGSMSNAAVVVIVSDNYLGRDVTIGSAVERVFGRISAVLIAAFCQAVLIGFGFLFFIIPGFLALGWLFATTNVVMVEDKAPFAALARSRELARGSVGRILATLFLCFLIVIVLQALITAVVGALIGFAHISPQLTAIVANVLALFIYPFFMVVITLLYYDLRIRKEGLDLELMARELGLPAPAAAPA